MIWNAVEKHKLEEISAILNNICLGYLSDSKFRLAGQLLQFGLDELAKNMTDQNRKILTINRAQSYKWLGDEDKMKTILKSEDWSACDDIFKLAKAVLEDQGQQALAIFKKLCKSEKLDKSAYREWPLFREFRKNEDFQKLSKNTSRNPWSWSWKVTLGLGWRAQI